jgi:subtilase family serine protease
MFNAFATEENLLDSSLPFVGSLDPGIVPSTPPNNGSGSISFIDASDILELEKLYPVGNPAEPNNKLSLSASLTGSDLIINSISAPSATVGNYLDFTYNIKNQGAGNAGANYTGFYLSTDTTLDSSDAYLGYDYVNSLAAGSSSTESASVYLSSRLSVGTYYLFTKADGWGYVSEDNETNNVSYQAITIAEALKPDLIINSISATSVTAGTTLNFTYDIKNQGAGSANYNNYTGFYLSTDTTLDGADTYLGYDSVVSLAGGASSTESASVYISSGLSLGTYYLFAKADGWNYIAEDNETNNVSYQAITVVAPPKPDLIINSISATSVTAGTTLNFTYDIKNQGAGNAVTNYTGFYLSTDTILDGGDIYLGSDDVNPLTAGSSSTESASVNLAKTLAAGNYYLFAKADGGNAISESDENNNVSYQAITIAEAMKSDLIINSISATSATVGTSFNFSYSIQNQGAGSTDAGYTGFYLSTDTILDSADVYVGSDGVSSLLSQVSSTESATVFLSSNLGAGTYYLFAKADAGNNTIESDETNNVSYQAITIQAFDGNTDWFSTNLQDAQLITLTRSLATDGNLSRNDMIALFGDAEDSAVIDINELTDLRTIVSNATLFTMQDYVRVLSDYVVNGNAANQWWTGGGTTRTSLGNLYAGSSDIQMEKLVGKWFLGTDRPDLRTEGDIANQGSGSYTGTKTYRSVSGSLFQNGISADDIKQGAVGDCYYVATLSSIAQEKPNYIQNMFIDNGDNTYTVRFFNNGVANYVTVDNYLPTNSVGNLIYASSGQSYNNSNNELWVALAEKAYAQLAESGWSRPSNVNNGYGSIEGGWMDYVIKQVTGLSSTFKSILNMNETQLINLVNSNQILTAGFVNGGGYGVYNSHAYSITAYDSTTGKFHLRNPWASSHADVTWGELTTLKAYIIYSNT